MINEPEIYAESYPVRVAFQGESGAYSEAAALEHWAAISCGAESHSAGVAPPPIETVPHLSFDAVFEAVENGLCEFGLIPIENSLAGSIHRNYDLLLQHNLYVTGEHFLPVHHCLIVHPGTKLSDLRKVVSHPQALAQCEGYLRSLPGVTIEPVYDTAGSVKLIRQQGDCQVAAIASRRAAELYGMDILAECIEDHPENITRFLAISTRPADPHGDAKTSIVFSLDNQPGALFKAMSVFALRNIDLTKIESRPLVGKPWEYFF